MSTLPIADYALLSDCRSAALVSRTGSIDWMCVPRFDGSSIFARLLDEQAGHWSIKPAGTFEASRGYIDATMVLESRFRTSTGTAMLLDTMAIGRNEQGHELGVASPGVLLRSVRCESGAVEMEMEYAPRPEYGLISPQLTAVAGGVLACSSADTLLLSSQKELRIDGSTARGRFVLQAGEQADFALQRRASGEEAPQVYTSSAIADSLQDTQAGWRTWSELHQRYEGPWQDLVRHSGRVLQALMFRPTGAIVAAATTSLPESVGGERNWDYRFTWIRDASLTMEALWVAACPDEAVWFFDWMAEAMASLLQSGAHLQIMLGVDGERDLSERSLNHLTGWRGSRPVRIGNGAWEQRQLDVYGELLCAAYRLSGLLGGIDEATRRFLVEVANAAAAHWQEQDQGIWEMRESPKDFLHSKLLCWAALDRAIHLAEMLVAQERIDAWTETREQIRDAILKQGWSEKAGAYTQAFGSDELDASVLMMPIVGFLPATDPRMRATIEAIAERLTDAHGLVYRYLSPDGLAGGEGTFLLCTFWLAHAFALAGEVERARTTFEQAIAYINDVGLLAEEVDPATNELLGNFPQAFSHIGLVNAAWAISQAESPSPISNNCG